MASYKHLTCIANSSNEYPLIYKGVEPVKGLFTYNTTNCSNGKKQLYPRIYPMTISNYTSIGGHSPIVYDNIRIQLVAGQIISRQNFYYNVIANESLNEVMLVLCQGLNLKFHLSHNNASQPHIEYSTLPCDVYVVVEFNFMYGPIFNWEKRDGNYYANGQQPHNPRVVYKIPQGTSCNNFEYSTWPDPQILSAENLSWIIHRQADFGNFDFSNPANAPAFQPGQTELVGGNSGIAYYQNEDQYNSCSIVRCFIKNHPDSLVQLNHIWETLPKYMSQNEMLNDWSNLSSSWSYYDYGMGIILSRSDSLYFSVNFSSQYTHSPGGSKALYFNTYINRGNDRIIDYGVEEIYENTYSINTQIGITYSTNGNWYTTENGNTIADSYTITSYYRASEYKTERYWSYLGDSGAARVEISTIGTPPTSQTYTCYINQVGYLKFPANGFTIGTSHTTTYSPTIGYTFAGYLTAPSSNDSLINDQLYKGTYVFDYDNSYISRFRYSIGQNVGWNTYRTVNNWEWKYNTATFTGRITNTSNGNLNKIKWFKLILIKNYNSNVVNITESGNFMGHISGLYNTNTNYLSNANDFVISTCYWDLGNSNPSMSTIDFGLNRGVTKSGNTLTVSLTQNDIDTLFNNYYYSNISFTTKQHSGLGSTPRYIELTYTVTKSLVSDWNNAPVGPYQKNDAVLVGLFETYCGFTAGNTDANDEYRYQAFGAVTFKYEGEFNVFRYSSPYTYDYTFYRT